MPCHFKIMAKFRMMKTTRCALGASVLSPEKEGLQASPFFPLSCCVKSTRGSQRWSSSFELWKRDDISVLAKGWAGRYLGSWQCDRVPMDVPGWLRNRRLVFLGKNKCIYCYLLPTCDLSICTPPLNPQKQNCNCSSWNTFLKWINLDEEIVLVLIKGTCSG